MWVVSEISVLVLVLASEVQLEKASWEKERRLLSHLVGRRTAQVMRTRA